MLLELELLGIDEDGLRYLVEYKLDDSLDDANLKLRKKSFISDYSKVFLKNKDKFKVSSLLIRLDGTLVFKDVVSTKKEYELSVMSKGVDVLFTLVNNFIN